MLPKITELETPARPEGFRLHAALESSRLRRVQKNSREPETRADNKPLESGHKPTRRSRGSAVALSVTGSRLLIDG